MREEFSDQKLKNLSDPRNRSHRECVYFSYRQWLFTPQAIVLQARLRSGDSAPAAAGALRQALRDVDPNLALYDMWTIEQATERLLASERLAALLTTFFGSTAALLCALGIYGVVSRDLAVRAREAAIRMALGGRLVSVIWLLARRPLLSVFLGLAAGVVLLLGIAPGLRSLLTDVRPSDPLFVAGAVVVLLVVAAMAVAVPAWRVRNLQPASVLRND